MNINEFARALKTYAESQPSKSENGDAVSLLELLFDAYVDFNGFDREAIRKDFHDLYADIYPVGTLCRDHEKTGFQEGVKVGIRLAQDVNIA